MHLALGIIMLSIHLVTWNGAKYLPYFFAFLKHQTFKDWELFVLDNSSTDESTAMIERACSVLEQPTHIFRNDTNVGFARGYNQLLRQSAGDLQLIVNQDIIMADDCLGKLVRTITWHDEAAAVAPLLFRWDTSPNVEHTCTDKIDAFGLKVFRNRRVVEWLSGLSLDEIDKQIQQFSNFRFVEVFGVSGTLALFRRDALMATAFADGTIFDETYGSYKEDVDLAYRLRSAGYRAFIVCNAAAYHARSAAPTDSLSDISGAKHKASQPATVRKSSYVNHLVTLYKNEYWQNFLLDFPFIFWYEWKKFAYFLLFDRKVLTGLGDLWQRRGEMQEKRRQIVSKRKVEWREVRKWYARH